MGCVCIEELDAIKTKYSNILKDNNTKISEYFTFLNNEKNDYKNFIQKFFNKDGEEERIREMFKKLKEGNIYPDVRTIDLNYASKTYEEYNDGMNQFLKEILELASGSIQIENYQEKLRKASDNDKLFILSLFGGENNQYISEDIRSAVSNVSYLVSFLEELELYSNRLESLFSGKKVENNLIAKSIDLYIQSVSEYWYNMIASILETYDNICKILFNRPKKEVSQSEGFQVF